MNRMKSLAGAVAFATIAAVTVSAAPGGFGGPRGGRHGHHQKGDRALAQLDLTQEQREQIRDLVQRHRDASKPLFERAKQSREELHAARRSGTTDATRLGQLMLAAEANRKELEASRAQLREQIATTVLNADQREKLEKLDAERKQKREEWREKKDERREQRRSRR